MAENVALHKGIFLAIHHLNKMKFAVLEIGNCNATESKLFTDANCEFDMINMQREEVELKQEVRSLNVNFSTLFRTGFDFLISCQDRNIDVNKMDKAQMEAMFLLNNYFQNIGLYEESLMKVLSDKEPEEGEDHSRAEQSTTTETDIMLGFAEHLLGRLAPGQSYIIDSKAKKKGKCKCGCNVEPKFGSTGIGHKEVWHGNVDIIFLSHNLEEMCIANYEKDLIDADCSTSACSPLLKRWKEDVEEEEEVSPREKPVTEVKKTAVGTSESAIAQTIVFSLLQRQRRPNSLICTKYLSFTRLCADYHVRCSN